jgi:hypothetical protein
MNSWREKKEWIESFEEVHKRTRLEAATLEFKLLKKDEDEYFPIAEYDPDTITIRVNTETLKAPYSNNLKLSIMMHEFGHHFDHYFFFPIMTCFTCGGYYLFVKIFNKKLQIDEGVANWFLCLSEKIFFRDKKENLYRDYKKFFYFR